MTDPEDPEVSEGPEDPEIPESPEIPENPENPEDPESPKIPKNSHLTANKKNAKLLSELRGRWTPPEGELQHKEH